MRIGVATWGIEGGDIVAKVERFAELGFGAVSFYPPQFAEVDDRIDDLSGVLDRLDIEMTFHLGVGAADAKDEAPDLEGQFALIARCQERSGRVRCATFDPGYFLESQTGKYFALDATVAALKLALGALSPHAIPVGIETWLISMQLEQLQEIQEGVGDDRLGLLLDIGHLNIGLHTGELKAGSCEEYISQQPFRIIELHVHDNDGVKDEHWPLGKGNLDLGRMMSAIVQSGFDGVATVEVMPDVEDRSMGNPVVFERLDDSRQRLEATMGGPTAG